jgi:hypothetical protein
MSLNNIEGGAGLQACGNEISKKMALATEVTLGFSEMVKNLPQRLKPVFPATPSAGLKACSTLSL